MRIIVLIVCLAAVALATDSSSSSTKEEGVKKAVRGSGRQERSIRDWFSGFMKRFQPKDSHQEQYYVGPRQQGSYYSPSYLTPPSHYGGHHQNHQSSYGQSSFTGIHGGGAGHGGSYRAHGIGHNAGRGAGHGAGQHGAEHSAVHSAGHGAVHRGAHSSGHGNVAHSPQGFGPLKTSDIVNYSNDNSAQHGAVHSVQEVSHGHGGVSHRGNSHEGIQQESYIPPTPVEEYVAPSVIIDDAPSYVAPSNSIEQLPVASPLIQYASPNALPLEQKEGSIILESNYAGPIISDQYQASSATSYQHPNFYTRPGSNFGGGSRQVHLGGNTGDSVYAPSFGPDDPIIEIVFQDGEPAPPYPLPVIDESLFDPVSDDVEVFFIEYSPEDNLDDLKNLDLSGAQPAILQDLPNELPYELRNHLINSGVLENAQIEIIDLDRAIHDQSLDVNTRNALRQAYSRTNRQAPDFNEIKKDKSVDIRVQRLNHDSSTPEGIVEFLSGLKKFRKGTYAGVVEVNDKNTDKYLPVTIDGDKLPIPDNILPRNRKLDGVLVLAPEQLERKARGSKATSPQGKSLQASSSDLRPSIVNNKQRRLLDTEWADMDTNGWIPIVNVDT